MRLNLYKATIKGKAYLSISVMAQNLEEAIADIMKTEGVAREDITSIKEE